MRISEILFWDDQPDPQLDFPEPPSSDFLSKLSSAYAKDSLISRFRDREGWESHSSGPVPPDTELIPSGTLEPTTASRQAEPVETDPQVGRHGFIPFR
jgi:hypothetical protein